MEIVSITLSIEGNYLNCCKGFNDWLYCLRCPHLSTQECPIESEESLSQLSLRIRDLKRKGFENPGDGFGSTDKRR
jgi:hypothetical protein